MRGGAEEVADAGEVSDARRGIPRGRYQMHGGITRGRYQTRGGEVSDARRYPAGKVYVRRAEVSDARRGIPRGRYPAREVSDARRYPPGGRYQRRGEVADARRYQMRGAEGAYVRGGGAGQQER